MTRALLGLVLACAAGLLTAGARAEDKADKDKVETLDDTTFVRMAFLGNRKEILLGELGTKHATTTDVKGFARKMVKDHTKALEDLTKAAEGAKIDLPEKKVKVAEAARLEKLTGKEFDAAFMRLMVADHEKSLALHERGSKDLKNDGLRKYAENSVPVVREHLKMARRISDAHNGKSKDKGDSDKDKGDSDKDRPVKDRPFKDR